jgi:hypothetical protein
LCSGSLGSDPSCRACEAWLELVARRAAQRAVAALHLGAARIKQGTLLDNAKVGELTGEAAPTSVDSVDARSAWSLLGPTMQLADAEFLAFGEDFN